MAAIGCHSDWPIGGGHTVVVSEEGRLFTFGAGNEGQLGINAREFSMVPTEVSLAALGGDRVLIAAAGAYHSACCTEGGHVFTWGQGRWGMLGQGDETNR
eukprot:CAMPEP_0179453810 /NCGR_PEP_ID=MMETSP0799-20121207/37713_1 /TAXON_ID=46947 /ORGANISM="Geminigera cryophila, Strain CCMP2564" /LENGTH=99 /DNA_ID=CAMNT_0021251139 /DNA_START=119 /DNA_END=415 /DNA_ORIENTATION=-